MKRWILLLAVMVGTGFMVVPDQGRSASGVILPSGLVRKPDIITIPTAGLISSDQAVEIAENAMGSGMLVSAHSIQAILRRQPTPPPGFTQSGVASGKAQWSVQVENICVHLENLSDQTVGDEPLVYPKDANGCFAPTDGEQNGYVLIDAQTGEVMGVGGG